MNEREEVSGVNLLYTIQATSCDECCAGIKIEQMTAKGRDGHQASLTQCQRGHRCIAEVRANDKGATRSVQERGVRSKGKQNNQLFCPSVRRGPVHHYVTEFLVYGKWEGVEGRDREKRWIASIISILRRLGYARVDAEHIEWVIYSGWYR